MTYEMCRFVFVAAGILCGVMLIVTILLFLILKVPGLIGYFTGAVERKAVENRHRQIKNSDGRTPVFSTAVSGNVELSGKIASSGYLTEETAELRVSDETMSEETSVLSQRKREVQVEYEICYIHSDEIIG